MIRKALREHSKKLKERGTKKHFNEKDAEPESELRQRVRAKPSITAIPAPDLTAILTKKPEAKKEEVKVEVNENEKLCKELCSSFKFVVNNGVFEPNFEWLPCEILIRIFEYLNTRDLMTAGLVCRSWLEATQYFRLMRKILLHFQIFKYSDTAYPMNRFLNCSRLFPNIKFSIVKFTPKNDIFWTDYGDTVEELTFNSCLINKTEFLHIIRLCPNLRSLSINRCEDLYKTWTVVKKLSQVKMKFNLMRKLEIRDTSLMTKAIFDFMVASSPNITSLTLANCFSNMRPQDRCQILESLIDFIKSRPKQFKTLNLANTYTDELFLLKLADIENLKLDHLSLTFNGVVATLGRSGIVTLIRNQTGLCSLDFTDSKGLSNFCLTEICRTMKNLKKLILSKCWLINDGGLKDIHKLQNLEVLDISSCDRITDSGILEGLVPRGHQFQKLKELYLGLLPYMSIMAIYRLSQQFDELEVLDLSGSSNSITDEALQMIFRHQCKLTHLNLDCCAKITDYGLTGLTEPGEDRSYCPFNIDRLENLQFLNLGGCYHISDKTFYNAFNLPNLKEVNLSRCHNITETGITNLCRKCPLLETFDMSECYNVTDSVIKLISKGMTKLETLKLNGCTQITDDIFDDIALNCKYLKNLHIRRCPKIHGNPYEVLRDVRYIHFQ